MLSVIIHQSKFPNSSTTLCENFQLRGHEEKCFVLKFLYNLNFYYVTNKSTYKSTTKVPSLIFCRLKDFDLQYDFRFLKLPKGTF